ncbi:hypothetical protein Moror_15094, partial [Moniliophthora roreri MCA 2997]
CTLPCYEGLFIPHHDNIIQDLLFTFATWHSYCAMRQHTDSHLATFKTVTKELGALMRKYVKEVCSQYETVELLRERQAQVEWSTKKNPEGEIMQGAIKKHFTMVNYKTHALGHYVCSIKYYGTTDLISSSLVS